MSVQIARIGGETAEQYPAEIVGGKAANLARMAALGLPVPPAFVLPISLCAATVNGEASAAQDLAAALAEGIAIPRKDHRQKVRRPAAAASGLRAIRRRALHAGHARHGAQCRLFVAGRSWPCAHDGPSALCQRLPAPLSRKLRHRRARHRSRRIRQHARRARRRRACRQRSRARLRCDRTFGRRLRACHRRRRPGVERRSDGASDIGRPGRLSLVDERSRAHLSQTAASGGFARHRRHRAGDGLRQCRRIVGCGRGVFARSVDRSCNAGDRCAVRQPRRRRRVRRSQSGDRKRLGRFVAAGGERASRRLAPARRRFCRCAGR